MIRRNFLKKAALSVAGMLGLGVVTKVQGSELTYEEGWNELCKFMLKGVGGREAEHYLAVNQRVDINDVSTKEYVIEKTSKYVRDFILNKGHKSQSWKGSFFPLEMQCMDIIVYGLNDFTSNDIWYSAKYALKGIEIGNDEYLPEKVEKGFWVGENTAV